jgi:hypothetical protein
MKRLIIGLLFVTSTMLGCAQNHFNIPAENYAEKVKVLGVAPIFIDADSDITFPQKDLLLPVIADLNRKYEPQLVNKIMGTDNYFSVTLLTDDPQKLFSSLVARKEKRDDADIQYNKYFWKNDEIGKYLKKNRIDAVMVVVISGLTKNSKIYSSNLMTSLETNFNFLTMSAQVINADGTVLWEYPNFRGRLLSYYPLVNLQYPDFSESEANVSRNTLVRYKSVDGIRRTLEQKRSDILLRETQEPEAYGRLFDEITSLLKHSVDKQAKGATAADGKAESTSTEAAKPGAATGAAPSPTTSTAPAPATAPTPEAPAKAVAPATTPSPVAPATESAR